MPLDSPQRQKEQKIGKPEPQVKVRAQANDAVHVDDTVELPSWRKLAGVEPPRGDRPDPAATSRQDAARAAGRTEGAPGPKRSSELRDEEADAEQAAREGRRATEADTRAAAAAE